VLAAQKSLYDGQVPASTRPFPVSGLVLPFASRLVQCGRRSSCGRAAR